MCKPPEYLKLCSINACWCLLAFTTQEGIFWCCRKQCWSHALFMGNWTGTERLWGSCAFNSAYCIISDFAPKRTKMQKRKENNLGGREVCWRWLIFRLPFLKFCWSDQEGSEAMQHLPVFFCLVYCYTLKYMVMRLPSKETLYSVKLCSSLFSVQ